MCWCCCSACSSGAVAGARGLLVGAACYGLAAAACVFVLMSCTSPQLRPKGRRRPCSLRPSFTAVPINPEHAVPAVCAGAL